MYVFVRSSRTANELAYLIRYTQAKIFKVHPRKILSYIEVYISKVKLEIE